MSENYDAMMEQVLIEDDYDFEWGVDPLPPEIPPNLATTYGDLMRSMTIAWSSSIPMFAGTALWDNLDLHNDLHGQYYTSLPASLRPEPE